MAVLIITGGDERTRQKPPGVAIERYWITGDGNTITPVKALEADKAHGIVDGRLTCDGTDRVGICSNAAVRDALEFVVKSTVTFPKGLEMAVGQALQLLKAGATASVRGWIDVATVSPGEYVHIP